MSIWTFPRAIGIVLASLTFAVASSISAAASSDPSVDPPVTDPCGDANGMAWVNGTTIDTPDENRAAMFDIKSAWFEDIVGEDDEHVGVRVHLEMCADVPAPEPGVESHWDVRWSLPNSCDMSLKLIDQIDRSRPSLMRRDVRLESRCSSHDESSFSKTIFDGPYTVQGNRITWTLTPETIPGEPDELAFLTAGTAWLETGALARDGRAPASVHGGGFLLWYTVYLVGTTDRATGSDFTVGTGASR